MIVDFASFPTIVTGGGFHENGIVEVDSRFHVFDIITSLNLFKYFIVSSNTISGKDCMSFKLAFIDKSKKGHDSLKEWANLINKIEKDPSIKKYNGFDAFGLYWQSLSDEQKLDRHINSVPHSDSLKEWYVSKLRAHLNTIKPYLPDLETREIEKEKYKKNMMAEVEKTLLGQGGMITSAHAKELNKFYDWLVTGKNYICEVPLIENLIAEAKIPDIILDTYYSLVPQNATQEEIDRARSGNIKRIKKPFPNTLYFGAPIFGTNLEMLEYDMKNVDDQTGYYRAYTKDRVYDALKKYAAGFQHGFDNFLQDKISKPGILLQDESYKIKAIFDFARLSGGLGLRETMGVDLEERFSGWYNDGIEAGHYYRAWYYIFENHWLFEKFFVDKKDYRLKTGSAEKSENEKKHSELELNGLQLLISEEYQSILPTVISLYQNKSPKIIVYLLYALYQLGFVDQDPSTFDNKSEMHRKLKPIFKKIGSIQAFMKHLNSIDVTSVNDKRRIAEIKKNVQKNLETR